MNSNYPTCRKDIPYPSVSHESVPSLIDNLTTALYGTITKTVINGRVNWYIPCDPNNTAVIQSLPRNPGEGLLCYIIRAFNSIGPANLVTLDGLQTLTNKSLVLPGLQGFTATGACNFNGATINFDGSALTLPANCVNTSNIVNGAIVDANINASAGIAYGKLNLSGSIVNSDISAGAFISYSKLVLANSITNNDISSSAAIAYSKLALANSIVNTDISASAAIANSKLAGSPTSGAAPNTIVLRDGSGNFGAGTISASLNGTATNATNLAGGTLGSLPWQSNSSVTSFLGIGMPNQILTAGVGGPSWQTGIAGTTTNNDALSGYVGEYQSASLASGSAITLTTGTTANVTSVSLTAGDWDVWGVVDFSLTGATSVFGANGYIGGVNTTSATLGGQDAYFNFPIDLTNKTGGFNFTVPKTRISIASTTTIYLVAQSTHSAGTVKAYGSIKARRVR